MIIYIMFSSKAHELRMKTCSYRYNKNAWLAEEARKAPVQHLQLSSIDSASLQEPSQRCKYPDQDKDPSAIDEASKRTGATFLGRRSGGGGLLRSLK